MKMNEGSAVAYATWKTAKMIGFALMTILVYKAINEWAVAAPVEDPKVVMIMHWDKSYSEAGEAFSRVSYTHEEVCKQMRDVFNHPENGMKLVCVKDLNQLEAVYEDNYAPKRPQRNYDVPTN